MAVAQHAAIETAAATAVTAAITLRFFFSVFFSITVQANAPFVVVVAAAAAGAHSIVVQVAARVSPSGWERRWWRRPRSACCSLRFQLCHGLLASLCGGEATRHGALLLELLHQGRRVRDERQRLLHRRYAAPAHRRRRRQGRQGDDPRRQGRAGQGLPLKAGWGGAGRAAVGRGDTAGWG